MFFFTGDIVYCTWFVGVDYSRVVTSKTWGRGRVGRVIFCEVTMRQRNLSYRNVWLKLLEVRTKRTISSRSPDYDFILMKLRPPEYCKEKTVFFSYFQ